jgi:hypothetical protein
LKSVSVNTGKSSLQHLHETSSLGFSKQIQRSEMEAAPFYHSGQLGMLLYFAPVLRISHTVLIAAHELFRIHFRKTFHIIQAYPYILKKAFQVLK